MLVRQTKSIGATCPRLAAVKINVSPQIVEYDSLQRGVNARNSVSIFTNYDFIYYWSSRYFLLNGLGINLYSSIFTILFSSFFSFNLGHFSV